MALSEAVVGNAIRSVPKFCSAAGCSLLQLALRRVLITLPQSAAAVDVALALAVTTVVEDCIRRYISESLSFVGFYRLRTSLN